MHSGLESFLVKVQTIRDSFTPYRRTNTKDLFQPYSPEPEKIKALTGKTKALYEDLLRMKRNIVMERIKLREGKLLALVEHELKHYFGKPYENNYYTGMTQVSFIHSLIHLSIHPSVRPSIHPSIHPYIHLSIHPSIHSSSHPSTLPFVVRPSIHPSIHPSMYPSICPSVRPFVPSSFRSSVRLSLSPSSHLSVHPFNYRYVRLSVFSSVRLSIPPSIWSIRVSFIRSFVRPFLTPLFCPSIFPYVCPCAFDWSCRVGHLLQPIRSTTQNRSDT